MTAAAPIRSAGQPLSKAGGLPPRRDSLTAAQAGVLNTAMMRIIRQNAVGNWMLPSLATITPQYIEMVLRGALGGDHVSQWELFDLMEDTWPRLVKNLGELKGAVTQMDWDLEAWADDEMPPTPEAMERKKLVDSTVWGMRPAADSDDNGFEQTIFDIMDAWAKGTSVLEVIWEQRRLGKLGDLTVPNSTAWVHPRNYGWSEEGFIGLNVNPMVNGGVFRSRSNGSTIERFPENKFLVAIAKAKSGPPATSALLRALAWWWLAQNFSADWQMNLAQLFGIPFRWATYADNASDGTVAEIGDLLANMGSNGYGAFPEGTNLNFLEAGKNAGQSPQADLMERADKNCDLLILGQTLTSDVGAGGGGSLALGKVHKSVADGIKQAAANFVARVLNQQLIPAILMENYGDAEEAPYFCPKPETQKDLQATATMIKTAVETGIEVPVKWAHAELNIPLPQAGEETIERAQPAPTFGSPNGGASVPASQPSTQTSPETKLEEDPALTASDARAQAFAAAIADKIDPVNKILARIADIKDDAQMMAALQQFYAQADSMISVVTADVTRQQRALEQLTAPALAAGLEGKKP